MTKTMLQAAGELTASGAYVIPCQPCDTAYNNGARAKAPLVQWDRMVRQAWADKPIRDRLDDVLQWWTKWPDALIGRIVPAGQVCIDVDPRHGGAESIDHIMGGRFDPATLGVVSGGPDGGWHWFFSWHQPADETLGMPRLPDGGKADGVDVRKAGRAYTIVPPSPHPDTGRPYEWVPGPLLPPPPTLARSILRPPNPTRSPADHAQPRATTGKATLDNLVKFYLADAQEGSRNNQLFEKACRALEEGHGNEGLEALGRAALSVGLADAEVRATLHSAQRKTRQQQT